MGSLKMLELSPTLKIKSSVFDILFSSGAALYIEHHESNLKYHELLKKGMISGK